MRKIITVLFIFVITIGYGCTNFYFSNLDYQEYIKTEAYLLNKDQLMNIFSEDQSELINQKMFSEMLNDPFLMIRLKNQGNMRPYHGVLTCYLYSRPPIDINIQGLGFGDRWTIYVIQLTDYALPSHQSILYNSVPVIKTEWKELYVK